MASQGDYTAGANALMHLIYVNIAKLPPFEQNFIPKDKIPAASGAGAKAVIDAVDAYDATFRDYGCKRTTASKPVAQLYRDWRRRCYRSRCSRLVSRE